MSLERAWSRDRLTILALKVLLWIGAGAAIVVALLLVGYVVEPWISPPAVSPDAEASDPFGTRNMAQAAMMAMLPLLAGATVPLLFALHRPRPRLAAFGLGLLALLLVIVGAIYWTDVRENSDCAELNAFVLGLPAWLATLLALGTTRAGTQALAVARGGTILALHWLVIGSVGAFAAADVGCVLLSKGHGEELLADFRQGQPRWEAMPRQGCAVIDSSAYGSRVTIECRPVGPPACACAPAPTVVLRLVFDDGRLRSWTVGRGFGGVAHQPEL